MDAAAILLAFHWLTRDEQHTLLLQLHDAYYHPMYEDTSESLGACPLGWRAADPAAAPDPAGPAGFSADPNRTAGA